MCIRDRQEKTNTTQNNSYLYSFYFFIILAIYTSRSFKGYLPPIPTVRRHRPPPPEENPPPPPDENPLPPEEDDA